MLTTVLREKIQDIPGPAFTIAALAHVLFFGTIVFHIDPIKTNDPVEVAFLGAILDSFEVEKIKGTGTPTSIGPNISFSHNKQQAGSAVTSPNKPNFSRRVNTITKSFLKSAEQEEKIIPETLETNTKTLHKDETTTQPYQRLRLYR